MCVREREREREPINRHPSLIRSPLGRNDQILVKSIKSLSNKVIQQGQKLTCKGYYQYSENKMVLDYLKTFSCYYIHWLTMGAGYPKRTYSKERLQGSLAKSFQMGHYQTTDSRHVVGAQSIHKESFSDKPITRS